MKYQALTPEQIESLDRELENIKKEVKRIKYSVEIGDTLKELKKDPKYKKVFDEYYLKEEVVRTTMLLAEKYFMEADQRQSLQDSLIAMSHFNDWTKATVSMGTLSAGRLVEHANRIKEINNMLASGIPIDVEQIPLPPEGVPNV